MTTGVDPFSPFLPFFFMKGPSAEERDINRPFSKLAATDLNELKLN